MFVSKGSQLDDVDGMSWVWKKSDGSFLFVVFWLESRYENPSAVFCNNHNNKFELELSRFYQTKSRILTNFFMLDKQNVQTGRGFEVS